MRKSSSRNTVQFLDEIDRNPESQLRKLLKTFKRALYCRIFGILLIVLKKNTIIILMCGNCLNFLLWVMIFVVVS